MMVKTRIIMMMREKNNDDDDEDDDDGIHVGGCSCWRRFGRFWAIALDIRPLQLCWWWWSRSKSIVRLFPISLFWYLCNLLLINTGYFLHWMLEAVDFGDMAKKTFQFCYDWFLKLELWYLCRFDAQSCSCKCLQVPASAISGNKYKINIYMISRLKKFETFLLRNTLDFCALNVLWSLR